MFFILSKILSFFFMPLSWIAILLVLSFFWKRKSRILKLWAVIILFVFGNSFLLHEINLLWEVPTTIDDELGEHRVGVVLGGYAYYSPENDRITFRNSSDRFLQAVRLLKEGQVEHLILSGGSGYVLEPEMKESLYVGEYLDDIQVERSKFTIESDSRNTRENAINTASLLQAKGWDKETIVLITSAYHMRRSKDCFEKNGLSVIPFSAEPSTGERMYSLDHLFLPSAEVLSYWNILIHEWVGYISYKVMGYA